MKLKKFYFLLIGFLPIVTLSLMGCVSKPENSASVEAPKVNNKSKTPSTDTNLKATEAKTSVSSFDLDLKNAPIIRSTNVYRIFDNYEDLVSPYKNFIHKNFKSVQSIRYSNRWYKNYRLHQPYGKAVWKFNKLKNNFSWSVDEQWITNITKRDESASNIKLSLWIESITPYNKYQALEAKHVFKDFEDDTSSYKKDFIQYREANQYPLGIEFNLNELKKNKVASVRTPQWFDVKVTYNDNAKIFNFEIDAKPKINFTDDPLVIQKSQKTDNVVYIPSVNNFLGLSFEADNNQNKTIEPPFTTPSKAEAGSNVNALDLSTWKTNVKNVQNRYLDLGQKLDRKNVTNADKLVSELMSRTFSNLSFVKNSSSTANPPGTFQELRGGTWTMIGKVKSSDKNDKRYYVMTNQSINSSQENNYNDEEIKNFGIRKYVNGKEYDLFDPKNKINPLSRFWGFKDWKNRFENKENSNLQNKSFVQNFQVSILDLEKVYQIINQNLISKTGAEDQKNLQALKTDFEQWSSFKPLEFTDRYKMATLGTTYLDRWYSVGYLNSDLNLFQFNAFNSSSTSGVIQNTYNGGQRGWKENKWINTSDALRAGNGALIVSYDGKIVGIQNNYNSHNNGLFLYSQLVDMIGSNVDGSEPSKNSNPSTFGHAMIEAHKKNPNKFEVWNQFKDLPKK